MKRIVCVPEGQGVATGQAGDLEFVLYGHAHASGQGSVGAAVRNDILHQQLAPVSRAWDLLSTALSVIAADLGVLREESPDGWTRQLDLRVAVSDPVFWTTQRDLLIQQLRFLTTDIWNVSFFHDGLPHIPESPSARPEQDCVALLSGGLDSLIGTVDLVKRNGLNPYAVSQIAHGDKPRQIFFASEIGGGLDHLQLNHNTICPGKPERSQRARSILFLAYGVVVATALKRYHAGEHVTLYMCENGFISINPPLTVSRLGSLSTRTTHPAFIRLFQQLLDNAGLHVNIQNPYQFMTKGEMLKGCSDQSFLQNHGHTSTSCGRYRRHGYCHCGRCLPCLIRRAAFHAWGVKDKTVYKFHDLALDDDDHARYDDVRSAAMAVAAAKAVGLSNWAGPALSTALLGDISSYKDVVGRGLSELAAFLRAVGVM